MNQISQKNWPVVFKSLVIHLIKILISRNHHIVKFIQKQKEIQFLIIFPVEFSFCSTSENLKVIKNCSKYCVTVPLMPACHMQQSCAILVGLIATTKHLH